MSAPLFFATELPAALATVTLDEENSKHAIQVLRLKVGDLIRLTNGKGQLATARLQNDHRKQCKVEIIDRQQVQRSARQITLAISLLKNRNRFEWLLEKITELGVTSIIPLLCERTEKESARLDRMQAILQSALLQSGQVWLPALTAPVSFDKLVQWKLSSGVNLIATCSEIPKQPLAQVAQQPTAEFLVCIGPEGDFSEQEIALALQHQFIPVSLGNTRLRTETAGVVGVTLLACPATN
jgi:16S rRNA (uracil1498-N3)-methyltransferase